MEIKSKTVVVKKSNHKVSSGKRTQRRFHRAARLIRKKIERWELNQSNPDKKNAGMSRNGWNTEGLKRHLTFLEGLMVK